jgi:hypothetical protein
MTNRIMVSLVLLLGLTATALAADDKLATTLRDVVEENVRAYDAKDVAGVQRTMDTRSAEYDPTLAALRSQFEDNLTAKLVDFKYIGHDDEFAVARVKLRVEGPPGSAFMNNTSDQIVIFHQEGGAWKLWTDGVLGVEFK